MLALAGTMAFNGLAQDTTNEPTKIKAETEVKGLTDDSNYTKSQLEITNPYFFAHIDNYPKINNNNKEDTWFVSSDKIIPGGISLGAYYWGNFDGKAQLCGEIAKTFKGVTKQNIDITTFAGYGQGKQYSDVPNNMNWEFVGLNNDKFHAEYMRFVFMGKASHYGALGINLANKIYAAIGNNNGAWRANIESIGNKNLGLQVFGGFNPENGSWFFKSQNAIGSVGGFYSKGAGDEVISDLSLAKFWYTHRFNFLSKGDYSFKFQGSSTKEKTQLEAIAGFKNKICDFGAGIETLTKHKETKIGPALQAFKRVKVGPLEIIGEAYYAQPTHTCNGYLTVRANF